MLRYSHTICYRHVIYNIRITNTDAVKYNISTLSQCSLFLEGIGNNAGSVLSCTLIGKGLYPMKDIDSFLTIFWLSWYMKFLNSTHWNLVGCTFLMSQVWRWSARYQVKFCIPPHIRNSHDILLEAWHCRVEFPWYPNMIKLTIYIKRKTLPPYPSATFTYKIM